MKKADAKKAVLDKAAASRILRVVPSHDGFHFFRAPGEASGKAAISLTDFVEKLRTVNIRSVNFHFPRQDFEKWIRDVIGDAELSRRIGKIRKETHGENLRNEIIQAVKKRLEELKEVQTKT